MNGASNATPANADQQPRQQTAAAPATDVPATIAKPIAPATAAEPLLLSSSNDLQQLRQQLLLSQQRLRTADVPATVGPATAVPAIAEAVLAKAVTPNVDTTPNVSTMLAHVVSRNLDDATHKAIVPAIAVTTITNLDVDELSLIHI